MIAATPCAGPVRFLLTTDDDLYHEIEIIPIPEDTVFLLEAQALARRSDGGSGRAGYSRRALIYREAGLAIMEGPVNTDLTRESNTTWDVTIRVSGSNVLIVARGAAGQTVDWKMSYTFEEVS